MIDLSPRTTSSEDPDGFGLACQYCGHLFPMDVTMAVAAAHMEIEHGAEDVAFELAVLCDRCHGAMEFNRQQTMASGKIRSWWDCAKCHRTRTVLQNPQGTEGAENA